MLLHSQGIAETEAVMQRMYLVARHRSDPQLCRQILRGRDGNHWDSFGSDRIGLSSDRGDIRAHGVTAAAARSNSIAAHVLK